MAGAGQRAVLDANVLYPFALRDTLLRAAEAELCQICWSAEILEETRRNLVGSAGDQRQLLLPVDDNYFCRS